MKVALLQTNIIDARPDVNITDIEAFIMPLISESHPEVIILPEMWSTGFSNIFVNDDGIALSWMKRISCLANAAIIGSIMTEDKGKYYNRMYFVKPDGTTDYYDKRHLFTYSGEDKVYTAGTERKIVEWHGVRFLLQVCYDLRFPCFSRNHYSATEGVDYDAIIYVASWPESRRAVWDILLKARAIENQAFVFGVNRIGNDPNCKYNGGTIAIDAKGKVIAQAPDDTAQLLTVDLDIDAQNLFRKKFPVLQDAD